MTAKIKGSCHCGAVTFEVAKPAFAVSCNCSICRRYGAIWTHCPPNDGVILTGADHVSSYSWGDHMIDFNACKTCGCITHWSPGAKADQQRIALNLKMAEPSDIADIPIRHFDGADSWEFLD